MGEVVAIYKPIGLTPLEVVRIYKENFKISKKVSYAGRLDPMAEGVLVLLIGDENKKRKNYENAEKEYEVEILLGITTDTFDQLGLIEDVNIEGRVDKINILSVIKKFEGLKLQTYPPYSSKTVNGKPLYWWARQDRLSEIKLPKRKIEIKKIELLSFKKIRSDIAISKNIKIIEKVKGDFRQEEILEEWKMFNKQYRQELSVVKLKIACTAGTYMRSIASDLGKETGLGAFALSIKRTRVGNYSISKCLRV